MRTLCTLLLLCLLCISVQAGTLSSSVNRNQIRHNETVELTLHYDGDADDDPDVSALMQNFTVVSNNRSSSIQIINGNASRSSTWYYELLPRKTGTLLIPSFSINGDFSEAIAIEVSRGPNNATQAQQQIYTETLLDNTRVHVQQQAIITWRLVTSLTISDPQFEAPQIDGALVQDLGNRQYQRASGNGGTERVIEQRYAIFPQRSGNIEIAAQRFVVTVNSTRRGSMGIIHPGRNRHQRFTDAQTLEVLPAPAHTHSHWLPANGMEITQEIISADPDKQLRAGEAFTRVLRVRAQGLSAEQLPALPTEADGFKVYQEPPKLENKSDEQGVIGQREEHMAMIASRDGLLNLPAINIDWYDTQAAQWRSATLPATTLDILPGQTSSSTASSPDKTAQNNTANDATRTASTNTAGASGSDNAANTTSQTTLNTTAGTLLPWQMATALMAVLALFAAGMVVYLQRRLHQLQQQLAGQTSEKEHLGATTVSQRDYWQAAIAKLDLHGIHRALLLQQQAGPLPAALQETLATLSKHLYGNGPAPDQASLQQIPDLLLHLDRSGAPQNTEQQLAPLYR